MNPSGYKNVYPWRLVGSFPTITDADDEGERLWEEGFQYKVERDVLAGWSLLVSGPYPPGQRPERTVIDDEAGEGVTA